MGKAPKNRIQVSVSPELLERMDEYCTRLGITRSAYVSVLVAQNLDGMNKVMDAIPEALKMVAMNERNEKE